MRIVGGRWGGRPLAALGRGDPGARLRPTSDRVRESLFSMLSGGRFDDPLTGARVLDLFAGTGALGLEALSRGAASAIFVETGRTALSLLARNIENLGAGDLTRIVRRDATRLGAAAGKPADLVFLDPPYGRGLGRKALEAAVSGGWIAPAALVVWEEEAPEVAPDGFAVLDARRFGGTALTFLERAPDG